MTDEDGLIRDVKWSSPPPRTTKYDWPAIARKLMDNPGEWAEVFNHDRISVSVALRNGAIRDIRPWHGFEVRTANTERVSELNEEGEEVERRYGSLWLRYVPEKDERRLEDPPNRCNRGHLLDETGVYVNGKLICSRCDKRKAKEAGVAPEGGR